MLPVEPVTPLADPAWTSLTAADHQVRCLWALTRGHLYSRSVPPSAHTMRAYRRSIEAFVRNAQARALPLVEFTIEDARVWAVDRWGSPGTVRVKLAAIRALFEALRWAGVPTTYAPASCRRSAWPHGIRTEADANRQDLSELLDVVVRARPFDWTSTSEQPGLADDVMMTCAVARLGDHLTTDFVTSPAGTDNHHASIDRAFHALGNLTRRRIIERLSLGPASVSDLARPLALSLASAAQHLKVLEESGLVHSEKVGHVRFCRLEPAGFVQIRQWVEERRAR